MFENVKKLCKNRSVELVLILVVMECLRIEDKAYSAPELQGFNPCCNGMFENRIMVWLNCLERCFNPCCNGMFENN